jgi:hypothetical protein
MDRTNTSTLLKRYFNRGISILVPNFGDGLMLYYRLKSKEK